MRSFVLRRPYDKGLAVECGSGQSKLSFPASIHIGCASAALEGSYLVSAAKALEARIMDAKDKTIA
jgi:hypothetical protein